MSCALYAFGSAQLHSACKYNNIAALQEYTRGIGRMTLLSAHRVNLGTMRDQLAIQV